MFRWLKFHPKAPTGSAPTSQVGREVLDTSFVDAVTSGLDGIEFGGESVDEVVAGFTERSAIHPGLTAFVAQVLRTYPVVAGMVPVRFWWVAVAESQLSRWEMYAWGRRYESPDGLVREIRLLQLSGRSGEPPAPVVAAAAYATLYGRASWWPRPWPDPFHPVTRAMVTPERVRVARVRLADGDVRVLFEGGQADVDAAYASHTRPVLRSLVLDKQRRPGRDCASCKVRSDCGELRAADGILGVPAASGAHLPVRSVSATTLRYHARCPAQAYLSGLYLPGSGETAGTQLGRVVHQWLEDHHTPGRDEPCPAPTAEQVAAVCQRVASEWQTTAFDPVSQEAARQMLVRHRLTCPFQPARSVTRARTEPLLTAWDGSANAVVTARPDLIFEADGVWVWRETKTTRRPLDTLSDPLRRYPQIALGLLFLSRGLLGGPVEGSRLELELLHAEWPDLLTFDPTDTAQVEHAQQVIRELAVPWRADQRFEARPGRDCRWCPVSRWCPSALVDAGDGDVSVEQTDQREDDEYTANLDITG